MLGKKLFNNTRKPKGFLGQLMVKSMNSGHEKLAQWGMSTLPSLQPKYIVDLGCGGGKNVETLLQKYPHAKVTGVDYSEVSVNMSQKRNAKEISKERCEILQDDVSSLQLKDETYDLATAFETIYFWPGPVKSFEEVYRILKPGGSFMIVNESDGRNEKDKKWEDMIDGMTIYSETELINALQSVGFTDIKVSHHDFWISFYAHKE